MRKLLFLMAFLGAEASAQTFDLTECQTVDEMLSCPVRNSGDNAFHSIRYAVVAVEEGRTFPWAETTGVVEIPGGLEPDETVSINFPLPTLPERAEGKEIQYRASANPLAWLDDAATIARCWNTGTLSREASAETVTIHFSVDVRGVPHGLVPDADGSNDPAARQAFEAARRAIIRCGANGGLEGGALEFSITGGIVKVE
jgi:hypothetical protein